MRGLCNFHVCIRIRVPTPTPTPIPIPIRFRQRKTTTGFKKDVARAAVDNNALQLAGAIKNTKEELTHAKCTSIPREREQTDNNGSCHNGNRKRSSAKEA